MSNKLDLSDLRRDARSLTQELIERIAGAIESGALAPGERLPTTRDLARAAQVNAVTASRVYRRLAELGYVEATVGRGTFVRELRPFAADALADDWQGIALPAPRAPSRERPMQEAMRLSGDPGVVPLATGLAAPELLPVDAVRAAAQEVLAQRGAGALGYTDIEGLPALREQLAALGAAQGVGADPDEILVTTGARQGLDLVARTILAAGDVACVESPSFIGTLASLEATGARLIGIPCDDDGLDVGALERVLVRHPVKLVALQPVCQNPTGRHLDPTRRRRLLELARERSFFVLEDGVYSRLSFSGDAPPALRGEAPAHVVYVDSLSKQVGGGLRLGWIAARGPVFNRLVALKMSSDLHSSTLDQHVAARFLESGALPALRAVQMPAYEARAQALLAALERHLPGETDPTQPLGGHSLWVRLRRRVDERALYAEALRQGVSVTPGEAALAEPSREAHLRLSFSLADEKRIDEGVRRLAVAFRAVLRAERLGATAAVT